jgi:hypothetical protein
MVNTTCSSFQFAGLPGSSQGYATLGGALGSAARNGRRRVREGQRQGSSRRVELDAERAFTSGRASVRPLGRHPRATGRVEKYPTGAQSEGFGARGWERTGHATGGLGHGALGHRVEAAGQGGGGAKNSGHLRVVARTEVASESGDRKVGDTVSSRRRGRRPDSPATSRCASTRTNRSRSVGPNSACAPTSGVIMLATSRVALGARTATTTRCVSPGRPRPRARLARRTVPFASSPFFATAILTEIVRVPSPHHTAAMP